MMQRSREPKPIILPLSRYEKAAQSTAVERSCPSSLCGRCHTSANVGDRFCGQCGTQLMLGGTILVPLNYDRLQSEPGSRIEVNDSTKLFQSSKGYSHSKRR
jgi:hypothetical protein